MTTARRATFAAFVLAAASTVAHAQTVSTTAGAINGTVTHATKAVWSAKMMRAAVSASCGVADQLIFMVQPVQHRRRVHTSAGGKAMAGGLRLDQGR